MKRQVREEKDALVVGHRTTGKMHQSEKKYGNIPTRACLPIRCAKCRGGFPC